MGEIIRLDRAQPKVITGKQPNKNTGTGRHGMDARADELYPTPAPLTKALMREYALPKYVWEPAAGMGHMAAPLAAAGHTVLCSDLIDYGHLVEGSPRIKTGLNFLTCEPLGQFPYPQAIVTNPPFAISGDFVRKGLEFCNEVVILNRLAFLEGKARADIMDRHLAKVMVFSRRAPMLHRWVKNSDGVWVEWQGKKADSAMCFAWFQFLRNARDYGPATVERITWLNEDF